MQHNVYTFWCNWGMDSDDYDFQRNYSLKVELPMISDRHTLHIIRNKLRLTKKNIHVLNNCI